MSAPFDAPWHIITDKLGYESIYASDEDCKPGDLVADIFGDSARLIAAAPELYEALDTLLASISDGCAVRQFGIEQEVLAAVCAIAKARGEGPSA